MVNKLDFFKKEKKDFFKEEKSNPFKKKVVKNKIDDFTPERALKLAGGIVMLGVGVHLAKGIID